VTIVVGTVVSLVAAVAEDSSVFAAGWGVEVGYFVADTACPVVAEAGYSATNCPIAAAADLTATAEIGRVDVAAHSSLHPNCLDFGNIVVVEYLGMREGH